MGDGTSVLSWVESGRKFRQDSKFVAGRGERKTPLNSWAFFDGAYLFSHQPMMGKTSTATS